MIVGERSQHPQLALLDRAALDHRLAGSGDEQAAGRYVAEPGVNANGEDVVWVSYDLAVSMHRVRPLVKAERRLERLASPTPEDNRISFGCINLPPAFYEQVLAPVVRATRAVFYVLPETRTPQQQFGSYEVGARQMASAGARHIDVK